MVGLGNPGTRYATTRHNAGQRVVEELARRLDAGKPASRFKAHYWECRGPAGKVSLLVPTTFMNDSGRSVGPAAGSLHAAPAQVLVIHDEIDIPFGDVRGKVGGGHGGHNGLRSIIGALGSREFARIRVGVGRQTDDFRGDEAAWVLANHSETPADVTALLDRAADMAELALAEGIDAAIARFHAGPPGLHARERAARRAEPAGDAGEPDAPTATEGDADGA